MKQRSLQSKLFIAYLSMACLILFSFAAFFYLFVAGRLKESQISAMNTLNSSFQSQVDSAIQNLDTVSVNINYSNISKSILDQKFDLNISDDMLSQMSDLFLSLSGTELKAAQVNLYDFSGYVLQAGLSTMVKKTDSSRTEWLQKAREASGKKIITKPYFTYEYSKSAKYPQWMISVYRSFTNQYRRGVGVIETAKQCKSIFKSIISYEKKNHNVAASVYVFNNDGELIYPYDISEKNAEQIKPYFTLTDDSQTSTRLKSPLTGKNVYATRADSKYTGFTYLTVQPESFILAPVYQMIKILMAVVAAFLLVSVIISYRLSRSVVKPVKHLKHIIQRMELDTLGQEKVTSYPVSVNELEELYQAFQHMSDNLKDSMLELTQTKEQEIRARSMALQTQINPHFYYNSLSSISVLAENGDCDTVVKMCRNLSMIMRYITDTGHTTVTLADELDYVRKYLYCMKVRYQSSLNYHIDVDESILMQKVPKLLIQPFVENAVRYGSDCAPPWTITISSYVADNCWKITVTDTGPGFSEEACARIAENLAKADQNPGLPALKINGLGTVNVYLRWKLFCKEDIIFEYGNNEDGHGMASIGRYTVQEQINIVTDSTRKEST
ncbi:cache domain-containing sensor histidine kinase [Blautia obeum]|uniref:Histidine kinase-, DNA gyrase B-, and HSP90-like ATPase./Histidine kinase./HAMP domain n=1 Tax=Blautia obeum A2-162 TaxID=657314 RepID=D4LYT6_9FIRM|nr:sensor histidine kinase [Blautia obeum]CBL22789.1 Histidine kinase-, DNA gyrase B-, and HSP90-like ATPase./Histidine kinase./HAMP domain [Blautia obeum A2-162]